MDVLVCDSPPDDGFMAALTGAGVTVC
jgi:hypothetical protein